jgi:membrane-associated phospholipid phosphatase
MTKTVRLSLLVLGLSSALFPQTPSNSNDNQNPPLPPYERPVSWKLLVPNIAHDQVHIWTFPTRVFRNRNWIPTVLVLGTTAGLIAGVDPPAGRYFRRTNSFHGFNSVFNGTATSAGIAAAPVSLYVAGIIGKDSYARDTALLAGEAVGDAEIVTAIFKAADRRLRPNNLPPSSSFGDTWFEGHGLSHGSFPSGHTIAAFSVATVISRRYPKHRWVPYVAYGLAGLVGFSRMTTSAHFPADVFMGAAMGYSISRFSVLKQ